MVQVSPWRSLGLKAAHQILNVTFCTDAYFTPDTEEGRPPVPVRSLRVVRPLGWTMEVDRLPWLESSRAQG